jgi:hypothetical protein
MSGHKLNIFLASKCRSCFHLQKKERGWAMVLASPITIAVIITDAGTKTTQRIAGRRYLRLLFPAWKPQHQALPNSKRTRVETTSRFSHLTVMPTWQNFTQNPSARLGGVVRSAYIEKPRRRMMEIRKAGFSWTTTLHEQSVIQASAHTCN